MCKGSIAQMCLPRYCFYLLEKIFLMIILLYPKDDLQMVIIDYSIIIPLNNKVPVCNPEDAH